MAESIIFLIFIFWGCLNCHVVLNGWWSGAETPIYSQLELNFFIALAKIPGHEESISQSSFYSSGTDQRNEEGR